MTPELYSFRERRGENKVSPKRENPDIVSLVDEWLSEEKVTTSKIRNDFHDKANIRSAMKFYYDAKTFPRKTTEKQKLLLHYIKKIVLFCEDSVSVSDENNVLCCPTLRNKTMLKRNLKIPFFKQEKRKSIELLFYNYD